MAVLSSLSLYNRRGEPFPGILSLLPGLYFLAAAAFALIYFDSYGSKWPQFIRFVLVPGLIGTAFMACAVFLPRRTSTAIGVTGLSVLAAFFAFELLMTVRVFSRTVAHFNAAAVSAAPNGANLGGLPAGLTVKNVNKALGTKRLSEALLSGVPYKPVSLCSSDGHPISYRAGRYGFNNPDDAFRRPTDILVIGDSFIEGFCLAPGKDVVSQLRRTYPASVNAGTRGAGPLFELAVLGRFGRHFRPQVTVIAFFEGNDWENLHDELATPWLRSALSPNAAYGPPELPAATIARVTEITTQWAERKIAVYEALKRSRTVRNFLALHQTTTQFGLSYPGVRPTQPAYVDVLKRARRLTASWGGELILLYIPRADRYFGLLPRDFVHDQLRRQVLVAAKEAGVGVIDLSVRFRQDSQPASFYAADMHFSERGAAAAAKAISEGVNETLARGLAGLPTSAL